MGSSLNSGQPSVRPMPIKHDYTIHPSLRNFVLLVCLLLRSLTLIHYSIPQTWMFGQMRSALGIDKRVDILDHIHSLPTSEQEAAQEKIRAIERSAMRSQEPQPGLVPLMKYLESRNIPKGICTRNFDAPVTHLLEKFLTGQEFKPIVTREFKPPKPSPAGILHIAKSWGFLEKDGGSGDASQLIMVG